MPLPFLFDNRNRKRPVVIAHRKDCPILIFRVYGHQMFFVGLGGKGSSDVLVTNRIRRGNDVLAVRT